jgi:hypothetical protein
MPNLWNSKQTATGGCWHGLYHEWQPGASEGWFTCQRCRAVGICKPCLERQQRTMPLFLPYVQMRCAGHGGFNDLGKVAPLPRPAPTRSGEAGVGQGELPW